jgi:hypothetical protein
LSYKEKYHIWVHSKLYRLGARFYLGYTVLIVLGAIVSSYFFANNALMQKVIIRMAAAALILILVCYLILRFLVPSLKKTSESMRKASKGRFWWFIRRKR